DLQADGDDQLDPRVTQRAWLPSKGNGGFGMDFFVRTGQPKDGNEARGAVGEYFWDGKASTLIWVDPANRLNAVFFMQTVPFDGSLQGDFPKAVSAPNIAACRAIEALRVDKQGRSNLA
ncbi:MAG: class beta-lactamase-related serine hydrolase, partial [Alphaproteobacteria bacterium]|nr:class beta-lactamase-related serine hydrolase [Alphaproteobacteria bacterium]